MFLRRLYVRIKGELLTLRNSHSEEVQDGEAFLNRIESLLRSKANDISDKRPEHTRTNSELEERWDQAVEKHRRSGETKTTQDQKEAQVQPRPNPRILG